MTEFLPMTDLCSNCGDVMDGIHAEQVMANGDRCVRAEWERKCYEARALCEIVEVALEALNEIAALPDIGYDRNDAYTIAVEALERAK